ncbi:MAG TPA: hypothetical protein PK156_28540, partial [Polyangium sp.]|nr:hypothetical protein [Polyangium sp.]
MRTRRHYFGPRFLLGLGALTFLANCSGDATDLGPPCTTTIITEKLQQSSLDKIDILLAIDNSRSMADKQQILALAVPDLVKSLINPRCINQMDGTIAPQP